MNFLQPLQDWCEKFIRSMSDRMMPPSLLKLPPHPKKKKKMKSLLMLTISANQANQQTEIFKSVYRHNVYLNHLKIFINYSFIYTVPITNYSIKQNKSMKYFRNFRIFVQLKKIIGKHCHISVKQTTFHKKDPSKNYVPIFYIRKKDNFYVRSSVRVYLLSNKVVNLVFLSLHILNIYVQGHNTNKINSLLVAQLCKS